MYLTIWENPLLSATELSILSRGAKNSDCPGEIFAKDSAGDFMGFHGEITGEILKGHVAYCSCFF